MKYIDIYMTRCHNRHRDHVERSTVLRGSNYFQVLPAYLLFRLLRIELMTSTTAVIRNGSIS